MLIHPRAERLPLRSHIIPAGNITDSNPTGSRILSPGDQITVVDRQGVDIVIHPRAEWLPCRTIPAGNIIGGNPTGSQELSPGDQLTVVDGQGPDIAIHPRHPRAERIPCRTIPAGNTFGSNPTGSREISPGDKCTVVDRQGVDRHIHPRAERLPCRTTPTGNITDSSPTGSGEISPGDQLTVVDHQGADITTHPDVRYGQVVPVLIVRVGLGRLRTEPGSTVGRVKCDVKTIQVKRTLKTGPSGRLQIKMPVWCQKIGDRCLVWFGLCFSHAYSRQTKQTECKKNGPVVHHLFSFVDYFHPGPPSPRLSQTEISPIKVSRTRFVLFSILNWHYPKVYRFLQFTHTPLTVRGRRGKYS